MLCYNPDKFVVGVGFDVDTFLLDSLAQGHAGTSGYVLPGERLDETISAFYEKIRTPVLTDLQLDFGDITVYDADTLGILSKEFYENRRKDSTQPRVDTHVLKDFLLDSGGAERGEKIKKSNQKLKVDLRQRWRQVLWQVENLLAV